jgi:predicted ester cyclase
VNKALSRRLYEEVFGRGNLAAADEVLAQDCLSHGPGVPPGVGTEGIKRQALLLRTAMPDLRVVLNDQVAEGDRVVSRWTGIGTHSGPLALPTGTVDGTGRSISFDEIRIDRFAAGRIVESWFIPDRMTLWQQLGLMPAPASPPHQA